MFTIEEIQKLYNTYLEYYEDKKEWDKYWEYEEKHETSSSHASLSSEYFRDFFDWIKKYKFTS
jgi:hypothetical protein